MFKDSIINSLFAKIFALFWLTFGLLLIFAFFLPQLDTRRYSDIDSAEVKSYQQKMLTAIRERAFVRLLVAPEFFVDANTEQARPILANAKGTQILGAKEQEFPFVKEFVDDMKDATSPKKRTKNELLLVGPFPIHLNNDGLQQPYSVYFLSYVDPQREVTNYIFDQPILLMLFVMLISSPILAALAYSLATPIRRLQMTANAVAQGDFTVNKKLETSGPTELRQVGKSFNRMAQSLGDFMENRQKVISSVSHELRTPLTRLQLATSLLRRKMGEINEIQRIELEISRLNQMVDDVLLLARKRMENTIQREKFALARVWQDVLDDAHFEAEQTNIKMTVHQQVKKPEKYQIYGNLEGLASAVENIVRNALKYTTDSIEVTLQIKDHFLHITVDDNGPGLPENEYSRIFMPFYRVDDDLTKIKKGTGLGLAIVYNTVQIHSGEVWAEKSHLGGLRVVIKLPLVVS